ncbi:MAG: hypothetical protein AB7G13_15560 [Lautropia sp.]
MSQPPVLQFHFFGNARHKAWDLAFRPYFEALQARRNLAIEPVFDQGAHGLHDRPQAIAEGREDGGVIHPGLAPARFPDNDALCLPGLFEDNAEVSIVLTRLLAAEALRGYEDYVVAAGLGTTAQHLHARVPIQGIRDLAGLSVRVGNAIDAQVVASLGARPVAMPPTDVHDAMREQRIEAALMNAGAFFNYRADAVARWHWMAGIGSTPAVVLWNRRRIEALPPAARGDLETTDALAHAYNDSYGRYMESMDGRLRAEPGHACLEVAEDEREELRRIFAAVARTWQERSAHNRAVYQQMLRVRDQYRSESQGQA